MFRALEIIDVYPEGKFWCVDIWTKTKRSVMLRVDHYRSLAKIRLDYPRGVLVIAPGIPRAKLFSASSPRNS